MLVRCASMFRFVFALSTSLLVGRLQPYSGLRNDFYSEQNCDPIEHVAVNNGCFHPKLLALVSDIKHAT
jgi:hypothetical protein